MCTVGVPTDAQLITDKVFEGWREMTIDARDGYLVGGYNNHWPEESMVAVCRRNPSLHEAPDASCTCGIYVLAANPFDNDYETGGTIWVRVEATNYLEGTKGVRARNVKMVELFLPYRLELSSLSERYPNIKFVKRDADHPLLNLHRARVEARLERERIESERIQAARAEATRIREEQKAALKRGELPTSLLSARPDESLARRILATGGYMAARAWAQSNPRYDKKRFDGKPYRPIMSQTWLVLQRDDSVHMIYGCDHLITLLPTGFIIHMPDRADPANAGGWGSPSSRYASHFVRIRVLSSHIAGTYTDEFGVLRLKLYDGAKTLQGRIPLKSEHELMLTHRMKWHPQMPNAFLPYQN